MPRSDIVELAIKYADGGTEVWTGKGYVDVVRTPASANETPVLKDSDISYVQATLTFDRDKPSVVTPPEADGDG